MWLSACIRSRWLPSGLLNTGRAGGGISEALLLGAATGATDGCMEEARVEIKCGFGVEDAPRKSPVVMSVNSQCMPAF